MGMETVEVTAPEHWPEAVAVTQTCDIPTVTGHATFNIHALSERAYTRIAAALPMPEPPKRKMGRREVVDDADPAHLTRRADVEFQRAVSVVDDCWQTLPGADAAAKAAWVRGHLSRGGEFFRLHDAILGVSGFGSGVAERADTTCAIASPEAWEKASEAPVHFAFERAGTRLRFRLCGVSGARLKAIEAVTDPGPPPTIPGPPSNIPGQHNAPVPNADDPEYKARAARMIDIGNALLLEAALGVTLPGKDDGAKADWLAARPAGEVYGLLNFLRYEVLSYRSRADFGFGG